MARDPSKQRDPNKPKGGLRKLAEEASPKQRMAYVVIRMAEVSAELERLKAEKKSLRETLSAMRAAKKGGAED